MKTINEIAKELNIGAENIQIYMSSFYKEHIPSCDFSALIINDEKYNDIKEHIFKFLNERIPQVSLLRLSEELSIGTLSLSNFFFKVGFEISYSDYARLIPSKFYELAKERFSTQEENIDEACYIDHVNFDIIRYWAEIFQSKYSTWVNGYDRMIFPSIHKQNIIRESYPFIKGEIYYIRGISNNLKNAVILTSEGYYEIRDKCLIWQSQWTKLSVVTFIDDKYIFKTDEDTNNVFSYDIFDGLTDHDHAQISNEFNKIIKYIYLLTLYKNSVETFIAETHNYLSFGDKDDAAIKYLRGKYYYEQKDVQRALFELRRINMPDQATQDDLYLTIFTLRADLNESIGNIKECRNDRILAFSKNNYESKLALDKVDKEYTQILSRLPERDHLAIMFVDDLSYCVDENTNRIIDSISVFNIHNIPVFFKFKPGHPVKNKLYIRQGNNDFFYVPYIIPEDSFIERTKEFCHLLLCLGATEINVKSIRGKRVHELSAEELSVDGSASVKLSKIKGKYENNKDQKSIQEETTEWEYRIVASPLKEPHIPNNLFWYHTDTNWQRLYKERMDGTTESYERLRNTMTTSFTASDLLDIQTDVETILYKVEAAMNKKIKREYQQEEVSEWLISFKFKPLNVTNSLH